MHRTFLVSAWVGIAESFAAAAVHSYALAGFCAAIALIAAVSYVVLAGTASR